MDHHTDDLWQGGPWEHSDPGHPPPPAVVIPEGGRGRRPVLRTRRRRRRPLWIAAGVLGICLLAGGVGILLSQQTDDTWPDYQPTQAQEYSASPPAIGRAETGSGVTVALCPEEGDPLTWTQVYEKTAPSMVSIESKSGREYSTGTGVILTEDGYLVTNAHVVAGGERVQVVFSNNEVQEAKLVGFDASEDLAVLKVEAEGLTPAQFGDSSALRCGDPVAALGDPLGYRSTITDGIVSALDREVDVDGVNMVLIQTSAAINFGNSGGALLNQYGQVVGITTIKIVSDDGSAEGLGFAIPSQRVKYVVDALIDGREVRAGAFGFTVLTRPVSGGGLMLDSVHPNSDAYQKGLRAGDVIVAADGQPITGIQDLARLKLSRGPGDLVALTVLRDGVTETVEVALVDSALVQSTTDTDR